MKKWKKNIAIAIVLLLGTWLFYAHFGYIYLFGIKDFSYCDILEMPCPRNTYAVSHNNDTKTSVIMFQPANGDPDLKNDKFNMIRFGPVDPALHEYKLLTMLAKSTDTLNSLQVLRLDRGRSIDFIRKDFVGNDGTIYMGGEYSEPLLDSINIKSYICINQHKNIMIEYKGTLKGYGLFYECMKNIKYSK